MGSYGSLWVSMCFYGFLWVPMCFYGFCWVPRVSTGFLGFYWFPRGSIETQTDPDGHGQAWTNLNRPRWTWCSHWIQTVLPDFGTNDCGIRLGDLESEDIRTFVIKYLLPWYTRALSSVGHQNFFQFRSQMGV